MHILNNIPWCMSVLYSMVNYKYETHHTADASTDKNSF